MTNTPRFLIDTNIFINMKDYTPLDVYPCVWNKIHEMAEAGEIASIEAVKSEIKRYNGEDEIVKWIKTLPKTFFLPVDEQDMKVMRELLRLVSNSARGYTQNAIDKFAKIADSSLIATAYARKLDIVTNEKSDAFVKRNIKIPDACALLATQEYSVRCLTMNDLLREYGIVFV